MSRYEQRSSLAERLLHTAFAILAAVLALYFAIRLLAAIWPVLLILFICGMLIVSGVALLRRRSRGW